METVIITPLSDPSPPPEAIPTPLSSGGSSGGGGCLISAAGSKSSLSFGVLVVLQVLAGIGLGAFLGDKFRQKERRQVMRRKAFTTFVLSIIFIFFSSFSAMGQEKPSYITVKAGIYTPTDDLDNFDTGFNGELSFGHYFSPNFAVEAGVGYFETEESFSGFDPRVFGFYTEDDEVTSIPITLTARWVYPAESFELYLGGGVGLYFTHFEADLESTVLGSGSFDDDDTLFGAHFLVGANVNVSEVMFVGAEGKYVWTERAEAEGTVLGLPVEIDSNVSGYTITGNVGLRF
jgi:outer membrane protein W